jgi:hypothetical protein
LKPVETGFHEHKNASLTCTTVRSSDLVGYQAVKIPAGNMLMKIESFIGVWPG